MHAHKTHGWCAALLLLFVALALGACAPHRTGTELKRAGDEIVIAGRLFHTGAPVVLWTDPGGYDAYRTEKRFVPWDRAAFKPPALGEKVDGPSTPARFGVRYAPREGAEAMTNSPLAVDDFERVRGGGWDLPTLQRTIDQFVLHYDVCGVSRQCFRVLHDIRGLSVHFMLDIDGTIYQTLDVKERAWHATVSNDRSVGVEIANIGAYAENESPKPLEEWYQPGPGSWSALPELPGVVYAMPDGFPGVPGYSHITIPERLGDGGLRVPGTYYPATPGVAYGEIQGRMLRQFDFTPQQYESLIRLTATLCSVLPGIRCDYPRDADGRLVTRALSEQELAAYAGVLGHFHIQANKVDPGPAMDFERVIAGARQLVRPLSYGANADRETDPNSYDWP